MRSSYRDTSQRLKHQAEKDELNQAKTPPGVAPDLKSQEVVLNCRSGSSTQEPLAWSDNAALLQESALDGAELACIYPVPATRVYPASRAGHVHPCQSPGQSLGRREKTAAVQRGACNRVFAVGPSVKRTGCIFHKSGC